jgi:outer membrane protein TolC
MLVMIKASELSTQDLKKYLEDDNRHIKVLLTSEDIAKEQSNIVDAYYDIVASAKHEEKEYPNTESKYQEFSLSKEFQNGAVIHAKYRKASGTQEYNNIYTADDGEYLAALTLPIIELVKGINTKSYKLETSKLDIKSQELKNSYALQKFYFSVFKSYYKLLFLNQKKLLTKQLLQSSILRKEFIQDKIQEGLFAEIILLEAQANILEYKQNLQTTKDNFDQELFKLCYYLDTSAEVLLKDTKLPKLPRVDAQALDLNGLTKLALQTRGDFKDLKVTKQKLSLSENLNNLKQLPKTNLSVYALHDPIYGDGHKSTINMEFALQRSEYEAKKRQNLMRVSQLQHTQNLKQRDIKTQLAQLLSKKQRLQIQQESQHDQYIIQKKLLAAEEERFKDGASTLMFLTQRELQVLNAQVKLLQTDLQTVITDKNIELQVGTIKF